MLWERRCSFVYVEGGGDVELDVHPNSLHAGAVGATLALGDVFQVGGLVRRVHAYRITSEPGICVAGVSFDAASYARPKL